MEDLQAGLNDWRNIQDVVRQTFKALHGVVRSQGDKLHALEQAVKVGASAADLDSFSVSLSNKPTFVEMNRHLAARVEELQIGTLRTQVASKADKGDLKDLYDDMTTATKRLGDSSDALELLVRQQGAEIVALKSEVKKLHALHASDGETLSRLAPRKWVEESIAFETAARAKNVSTLQRQMADAAAETATKLEDIPSVATLDEVFAQKVDMNTLTRLLRERPTAAQVNKELAQRVNDGMGVVLEQAAAATRESCEAALARTREEFEQFRDSMGNHVTRGELLEMCGHKVGAEELDDRLKANGELLADEVRTAIVSIQRELIQVLNKKAFKTEVSKMLETKAGAEEVQMWLASKVEVADVRDSLVHKADLALLQDVMVRMETVEQVVLSKERRRRKKGISSLSKNKNKNRNKKRPASGVLKVRKSSFDDLQDALNNTTLRNVSDENSDNSRSEQGDSEEDSDCFDSVTASLKRRLRAVVKEVRDLDANKVNIKDVCLLLDQKANITDVNEALAQVGVMEPGAYKQLQAQQLEELAAKHSRTALSESDPEIQKLHGEVAQLTDAMNAELSTGRWIWSSGRALVDRAVPWNVECINTAMDNFIWKQDTADIITVVPGLYELHLGFFSEQDPDIQVLVNGEPVFFTTQSQREGAIRRGGGSGAPRAAASSVQRVTFLKRARHSAGNIAGWSASEFVALPGRARITVLYDGELGTQGFLSLRKL